MRSSDIKLQCYAFNTPLTSICMPSIANIQISISVRPIRLALIQIGVRLVVLATVQIGIRPKVAAVQNGMTSIASYRTDRWQAK